VTQDVLAATLFGGEFKQPRESFRSTTDPTTQALLRC
jgi:hypothetical protein